MSEEPENLVLKLLREMRSDVGVLCERADACPEELKALRQQILDWQAATGFAMRAKIRGPETRP
jgi:hypothetical protein